MKIRLAALGCALLMSLAGPGCIKTDSTGKVEKDGSGKLTQTVKLDLEKLKTITEMFKGMTGGGEAGGMADDPKAEPDLPVSLDDMKSTIAGVEGLKLLSSKQEKSADGKSLTMTMEIAFADLSLLTKANLLPNSELVKNADGTWTLSYDATMGEGAAGGADGKPGAEAMPFDPTTMLAMLEPMIGDMSVGLALTLPGTVTETNGTKAEDGSVSWKLGFKDIASNKASMKVTFKGDDLGLQPFKVKADPSKMMENAGKKRAKTDGPKPGGAVPPPDAPKPGGAVPAPEEKPADPVPTDPK